MVLAMDSVVFTYSESASSTTALSSEGSDSASSGLKLASVTLDGNRGVDELQHDRLVRKSVRCVCRNAVS